MLCFEHEHLSISLAGKARLQTALVTGASHGIGLTFVCAYLRKLDADTLERLRPALAPADLVDYGAYR
jgi:hypothetical protein